MTIHNSSYLGSSIKQFDCGTSANAVCVHAKLGQYYRMENLETYRDKRTNTHARTHTHTHTHV